MEIVSPRLDVIWATPFGDFELTFPPADLWMGYLLLVYLLVIVRIVGLIGPFEQFLRTFGGKTPNWIKRVHRIKKTTGLKGVYRLLIREIIILLLPIILALAIRISLGHPGKLSWSILSSMLFGILGTILIFYECYRIHRTRNVVLTIAKDKRYKSWRTGAALDTVRITSGVLGELSKLQEDPNIEPEQQVGEEGPNIESEQQVGEEENTGVLQHSLNAVSMGWEFGKKAAKTGKNKLGTVAKSGKEKLDTNLQEKFDKLRKIRWDSLIFDTLYSTLPLLVVYYLSWVLT